MAMDPEVQSYRKNRNMGDALRSPPRSQVSPITNATHGDGTPIGYPDTLECPVTYTLKTCSITCRENFHKLSAGGELVGVQLKGKHRQKKYGRRLTCPLTPPTTQPRQELATAHLDDLSKVVEIKLVELREFHHLPLEFGFCTAAAHGPGAGRVRRTAGTSPRSYITKKLSNQSKLSEGRLCWLIPHTSLLEPSSYS